MVWASVGKIWYIYLLNFALLFIASSMINTSWIQGIARGYSYIHLFGAKGLPKAMGVNIPTLVLFIIAYFISKIVFITQIQIASFFSACLILSTVVAVSDGQFRAAIEKTKLMESVKKK